MGWKNREEQLRVAREAVSRAREELDLAERKLAEAIKRSVPDEPPVGSVIQLTGELNFGSRTHHYVLARSGPGWYITGPGVATGTPKTWEEAVEWIEGLSRIRSGPKLMKPGDFVSGIDW